MRQSIGKSIKDSVSDEFKVLMSHRPRALDVAGEFGVDLILAGHTHGGQIGLNGRSVFEGVMKERYLWGKYQKGSAKLYTSSGVGHWFPYRLGCPAEAPIITLVKG
jgi:predicted MPP superfamily phosphohydrolase